MATAARQAVRQAKGSPTLTGTLTGLSYKLGQEIGAGGNGVVYAVSRRPEIVAKIQRVSLSQDDVEKLEVLVRQATPDLLAVAAWPTDLLRDDDGLIVGFVMPRILDARPLYELYSPRSRVQNFPAADYRFLVHAAANVARLFAAVHAAGFICGDVNHSNVLVRQTGTVAAVDCDSFQVGDGSRFPCLVGTDLFIPPELCGVQLGATRRNANHDSFGLAVLIFHLLFMGRHPFAGRFLDRGEMPIERAIAECRYAYSRDARRTRMSPPPYSPAAETVGPAVRELFERAFDPGSRRDGRPTPEAWVDALEALKASLVPCSRVAWHHHIPATKQCPWCAIEVPTRLKLFGGIVRIATAGVTDLDTLWMRYQALIAAAPPRPLPVLPPRHLMPRPHRPSPPRVRRLKMPVRLLRFVGNLWPLIIMLAAYSWMEILPSAQQIMSPLATLIDDLRLEAVAPVDLAMMAVGLALAITLATGLLVYARDTIDRLRNPGPAHAMPWTRLRNRWAAERAWKDAAAAWTAQPPPPDLTALTPPVEDPKRKLDALASERKQQIAASAATETEDSQRARYLGGFRIEDAKLPGIGPARCAVLRSWGIDTAADIDEARVAEIPGFGKGLTDKLIIWREMREKGFVANPAAVVDPLEIHRIDREIAARRIKLMKDLRQKIAVIETAARPFHEHQARLWAAVETAHQKRLDAIAS